MKKSILYYVCGLLMAAPVLSSCSSDDPDTSKSIISTGETEKNDFDRWLEANYLNPYNIEFKYRYEANEGDFGYYEVPSKYEDAIKLAHLVKYLCLEPYDKLAEDGINFTRAYFPKMIYTTGTWRFKNNNTFVLGTAEGGKKIYLMGTNYLSEYLSSAEDLNNYYLKTIHHEFTHILNQTKPYSASFQQITGTTYVADSWSEEPYDTGYLGRGYISAYAQMEDREDFAELVSMYVTNTAEQWEAWLTEAAQTDNDGISGRELIEEKMQIAYSYMEDEWGINLDEMRDEIQKRQDDVISGRVSLDDLTVE